MKAHRVLLFMILVYSVGRSQRVEVIDNSGFRHNYVVGRVDYVELPSDTARLKYIATVRISGQQDWSLLASRWHYLFKAKAKQLGGNAMRCVSYQEDSSFAAIDVRVYFAPESFLRDNRDRKLLNEIVVFNQARLPGDSGNFFLDQKRIFFSASGFFRQPVSMKKTYFVKNNTSHTTAKRVHFKKILPAEFFIVPMDKRSVVISNDIYINGAAVYFKKNVPISIDYELGRFMMDVYRQR